jgi:hypothetical protein
MRHPCCHSLEASRVNKRYLLAEFNKGSLWFKSRSEVWKANLGSMCDQHHGIKKVVEIGIKWGGDPRLVVDGGVWESVSFVSGN